MSGHKTLVPHASAPPALFGYIRRLIDAARQRATSAVIHVAEYLTSFPPHELTGRAIAAGYGACADEKLDAMEVCHAFSTEAVGPSKRFLVCEL